MARDALLGRHFLVLSQSNINDACAQAAALQSEGRFGPAADLWARISRAAPGSADALVNLAGSLIGAERFAEAEQALRRALQLRPEWPHIQQQLGNLLHALGRWDAAEPHYQAVLKADPELWRTRFDLSLITLGQGNFSKGWPLWEARRAVPGLEIDAPALPNEWQGEPLAGSSILVWPEQAFGDQIMFVRFVAELAARGADVTLVAPWELSALFGCLPVRVVERSPVMSLPEPDRWAPLLSLPLHLGVRLETLPAGPYLSAPPDRRRRWRGHASPRSVGVIWASSGKSNPQRSMPSPETFQPLADAGAKLLHLYPPPGDDFADTAAIMEQLDLIVTVDTATAHLAGALGKPCWVLLPWLNNDWRWMQGRDDSAWYRSVRLFRQRAHGDWAGVMAEVVDAWRARAG
jgi:hypothetical protein